MLLLLHFRVVTGGKHVAADLTEALHTADDDDASTETDGSCVFVVQSEEVE
jgi:hypothetical protein